MEVKKFTVNQTTVEYTDFADGKTQFLCVTEWGNGEGFDIITSNDKFIALSHNELAALNIAINSMNMVEKD